MEQTPAHRRFPGAWLHAIWCAWLALWRRITTWLVKVTLLPEDLDDFRLDGEPPVVYLFDTDAASSLLILDQICIEKGWPRPLDALVAGQLDLPKRHDAVRRRRRLFSRRAPARHPALLKALLEAVEDGRIDDVRVVPVTVLIGRAPDKEQSIAKILFSENWELVGPIRRFLSLLINGRATFVQFGAPLSLREQLGDEDVGKAVRRISRELRVHFKRVRTAAIGPDRSHRRTILEQVVRSESVREAIAAKARRDGIEIHQAEAIARRYAREIAADYSYTFVRIAEILLAWFWNRIYRGIEVLHFSAFREAQAGREIIYVPCHRSHIDYMLLSFILYRRGFVPPHIAAGVNLNLPVIGRLLRYGGAFFLRRSFRAQPLYAAVFNEYVRIIVQKGVALEYFIEGTRSRTGRLLPPRGGMLSITVRAFLRDRKQPMLFQPVWIGYERLVEGNSYISELSGQEKKPESLSDLRNVFNILRKNYGQVQVCFGEPIQLEALLDRHAPDWRDQRYDTDEKPPWLAGLINELGNGIQTRINGAAHANPVNLLAATLLATRKQALDEEDLERMIGMLQRLIRMTGYSDRVTVTDLTPGQVIEYGLDLGVVQRQAHPLGDLIHVDPASAVLLTYFRNNISHLLALPAWIACCFLNNPRLRKTRIRRLTQAIYPFLRKELFLPWAPDEVPGVVQRYTDALIRLGLLGSSGDYLQRTPGGTDQSYYLRLLGNSMLQTFERYYITIAILAKNGSGRLSRNQLEQLCIQCAQRISMLHEIGAPEFSDRVLFRQFIDSLQEIGVLGRNDDGALTFDRRLEVFARDAKLVLDREIRHTIIQIAPRVQDPARLFAG
ncbi:MAG: glycerol-3-phosphate 1-O-acyltransferase PlsB [Wenzhouxiangellaceae bacterium]